MMWTTLGSRNWGPWGALDELQREMDLLFGGFGGTRGRGEFPGLNIWTSEDDAVVRAELPGINLEDLDLSVQDDTVTIRSRRQEEKLQKGEQYLRRERGRGEFTRTVALPFRVESDQAKAAYLNGILEIRLPRAEADKPRKIEITAS